jgi:hypothetical protein
MINYLGPLIGRIRRLARSILVGLIKRRIIDSGRLSEISENRGYWYERLNAVSEEVICRGPKHLSASDIPEKIQDINRPFKFSPAFVCQLPHVKLMGPPALAFLGAAPILESAVARQDCMDRSIDLTIDHQGRMWEVLLPSHVRPQARVEILCSLVNVWSKAYFHWLLECLTRLEGLDHYIKMTGNRPKLLIDRNPPNWMIESLHLLGYTQGDLLYWDSEVLHAERFVLPSYRRQAGRTSIKACRWLKAQLFSSLGIEIPVGNDPLRVFVSRRKAGARRIVNEEQVMDCLAIHGFRTYVLEEMSFSDQVRLFSQADTIVAPHGAGLANMIFALPGTRVFEVFGRDYINPCFYNLAHGLNFDYTSFVFSQQGQDIVVDCNDFTRHLNRCLKS